MPRGLPWGEGAGSPPGLDGCVFYVGFGGKELLKVSS